MDWCAHILFCFRDTTRSNAAHDQGGRKK